MKTTLKKRRVLFCLWNDGTKQGRRVSCYELLVQECASDKEALQAAREYRARRHKRFRPALFTYLSAGTDWRFGYTVHRINKRSTSSDRGNTFVNHHSVTELDSNKPLNTCWMREDLIGLNR